jgi:NADPH:quinone reductase-like Zn-dependent oxidoreductase
VVTFGWAGAWAEQRAVDVGELAAVPDAVDLGAASALPVAAVTALRALRRLGPVVGRRVLVTGASGGVGRFAVQLAARAGAYVIAAVGRPARGEGLAALGASEVITSLDDLGEPVFGVLENVGGPLLAEAFSRTGEGGRAVSIGQASGQPTTIDFEQQRQYGGNRHIEPFTVGAGFGPDLAYLAGLLAAGDLDPQIGWRARGGRLARPRPPCSAGRSAARPSSTWTDALSREKSRPPPGGKPPPQPGGQPRSAAALPSLA